MIYFIGYITLKYYVHMTCISKISCPIGNHILRHAYPYQMGYDILRYTYPILSRQSNITYNFMNNHLHP